MPTARAGDVSPICASARSSEREPQFGGDRRRGAAKPRAPTSGGTPKGSVVKQYEPFFSTTSAYQDEAAIVQWGVTAVTTYDPVGRPIRTDFPDGTVTRADPLGLQAGLNLYLYGRASPVVMVDPDGMDVLSAVKDLAQPYVEAGRAIVGEAVARAESQGGGAVAGGLTIRTGEADRDAAYAAFLTDLWNGVYRAPEDAGTLAGGVRKAAQARIGDTIDAVADDPIGVLIGASNPINLLAGVGVGAYKATTTGLEALDTADAGRRNELYGEALFGAGEVVAQILASKVPGESAAPTPAKPGAFARSPLGRVLLEPMWRMMGAEGPGGGAGRSPGTKGPSGRVSLGKYLERRWDKATFASVEDSAQYHVSKHGQGLGVVEYTQSAERAFGDASASRRPSTDLLGRDAIRLTSEHGSGLFTPKGRIIWFHPRL